MNKVLLVCSFSLNGWLLNLGSSLLGVFSLRGMHSYPLHSLFGATRVLLKCLKGSTTSFFWQWVSRFSGRKGWSAPTSIFPHSFSYGSETRPEAVSLLIARLSDGKWFWLVESDATQLSPSGGGQNLQTTLPRALFSLHLGTPISLSAIHFSGSFWQSDLIELVWRAKSVFTVCNFTTGGSTVFNLISSWWGRS